LQVVNSDGIVLENLDLQPKDYTTLRTNSLEVLSRESIDEFELEFDYKYGDGDITIEITETDL